MGNGELTKASILATICVENNAVTSFHSEGLLPPRTLLILTSQLAPAMASYTIIGILSCLLCEHRGQPESYLLCDKHISKAFFRKANEFPESAAKMIGAFSYVANVKLRRSCQRWVEKGSHSHLCSRPGKCTQGGCVVPWSQERIIIFWSASCIKKN